MDICVILALLILALGAFYLLLREGLLEHPAAILGSAALIATATMSTNGIKQATNDAFAAFKAMQNGGADE